MRPTQLSPCNLGRRLLRIQPKIGQQIQDGVDRRLKLDLRDVLTNTHMRAKAKAEGRFWPAVDIEHLAVLEGFLVAIGGRDDALDHGALGHQQAADLDVLSRLSYLEG